MEKKYTVVSFPEEGMAQITLNRPEALNALSGSVVAELGSVMDELEENPAVRVVILTGVGAGFIAGADIEYMHKLTPETACVWSEFCGSIGERMRSSRAVYISAVNGYAFGAGTEVVLASDLAIASEKAKFCLPEVGLGILPGAGGTQRLCTRIGMQKAKEMVLTGDPITAAQAEEYGIVLRTVAPEDLLEECYKLARRILKNPPLAIKYAKDCMQYGEEAALRAGIRFENTRFGLCFADEGQKEGMGAFLEKRKPNFKKTF